MNIALPWTRDTVVIFAGEVAAVAAILVVAAIVMRRRGRRAYATRLFAGGGIALAVMLASLVAAYTIAPTLATPYVPFTAQFEQNPVPNTAENISAGKQLFQQNCVVCHGLRGLGDGPAALALNPRPVNLTLHVPQHPDGFIHYWVSNGVPGTQMPAWKNNLSDTQIWQVIRYLRELAAGRP